VPLPVNRRFLKSILITGTYIKRKEKSIGLKNPVQVAGVGGKGKLKSPLDMVRTFLIWSIEGGETVFDNVHDILVAEGLKAGSDIRKRC